MTGARKLPSTLKGKEATSSSPALESERYQLN